MHHALSVTKTFSCEVFKALQSAQRGKSTRPASNMHIQNMKSEISCVLGIRNVCGDSGRKCAKTTQLLSIFMINDVLHFTHPTKYLKRLLILGAWSALFNNPQSCKIE